MHQLKKLAAMLKLSTRQFTAPPSSVHNDYEKAASTYAAYTCQLADAGGRFLEIVPVEPGQCVVDGPTGPGTHTARLGHLVGPGGRVFGVDVAEGMILQARKKCRELDHVTFWQGDLVEGLRQLPEESLDGIFSAFGLVYLDHHAFFAQATRVLRPGGWLAVIENTGNTLAEVVALFQQALLQHPDALVKKVLLHLPDASDLLRRFRAWGYDVRTAYDGAFEVPCAGGRDLIDYLTQGGVGAGYLDALKEGRREEVLNVLARCWDTAPSVRRVRHEYAAVLGIRQAQSRRPTLVESLLRSLGAWGT